MKTLVVEPGYFPELKYISSCLSAERVVVADNVRFRKKSLFNRATIRNPIGSQRLSIPLASNQRQQAIVDVKTAPICEWAHVHMRGLGYNYRTSPYFEHYESEIESFLADDRVLLGSWAAGSMELSLRLLGIEVDLELASTAYPDAEGMLELLSSVATESTILVEDSSWWKDTVAADSHEVFVWTHPTYNQNFDGFFEGMSVLDLLFNYGPDSVAILKQAIELVPSS